MFIDDKLRKALVEGAEQLGISANILLDYVRSKSDEDKIARTCFKNLLRWNVRNCWDEESFAGLQADKARRDKSRVSRSVKFFGERGE